MLHTIGRIVFSVNRRYINIGSALDYSGFRALSVYRQTLQRTVFKRLNRAADGVVAIIYRAVICTG